MISRFFLFIYAVSPANYSVFTKPFQFCCNRGMHSRTSQSSIDPPQASRWASLCGTSQSQLRFSLAIAVDSFWARITVLGVPVLAEAL